MNNVMYAVIETNDQDYNVSWTGNYPGYSCKMKGLYLTYKEAKANIKKNGNDWNIIEIPLNQETNILLGLYISYHENDY